MTRDRQSSPREDPRVICHGNVWRGGGGEWQQRRDLGEGKDVRMGERDNEFDV
jgi:hypothetical protein